MASEQTLPNGLPSINRFITDHNEQGKAIFATGVNETLEWQDVGEVAKFALGYTTSRFPVKLEDNADITDYEHYQKNKPGITIPGGTVLRIVDMAPGTISPMHRTVSLDYGVVLEGEVECVLDSGEVKLLRRGDVCIQRGTNHAWRNKSETTWSRMLYVLQESAPILVDGKALEEDYGGNMPGVRPSAAHNESN